MNDTLKWFKLFFWKLSSVIFNNYQTFKNYTFLKSCIWNILDMTELYSYYFHPFIFYLFYTSHTFLKSCNLSKGLRATCHGLYFHNPHVVKHFIHVFMFVLTEIKEKLWGSFLLLFCPRVCLALTHKRTV